MLAEGIVAYFGPVPVEMKACQRAQVSLLSLMSGESVAFVHLRCLVHHCEGNACHLPRGIAVQIATREISDIRILKPFRTHVKIPSLPCRPRVPCASTPVICIVLLAYPLFHQWIGAADACWIDYFLEDFFHVVGIAFVKPTLERITFTIGFFPGKVDHVYHVIIAVVNFQRIGLLSIVVRVPIKVLRLVENWGAIRVI